MAQDMIRPVPQQLDAPTPLTPPARTIADVLAQAEARNSERHQQAMTAIEALQARIEALLGLGGGDAAG